ncbi:sulfotransferase domain-containing protein [Aurantiacibacter marinus]|uniref:Sulfotransferase domain-containing protein n=1 Tax=Aurantiacibacter marinus TaxID=874156 RepID=A0A0H0XP30_9SPHN|nr:sulfotransferase domain-containing protein [Aurantiacibacter marinus]KLI63712.1 hypothetical protein AAV99_08255 [Aurantiacibacter marinus]
MNSKPIMVASHPRSGTHLVLDTLRRQFPTARSQRMFGRPLDHLYLNIERLTSEFRPFSDELAGKILSAVPNPLMKTHYLADLSETWVAEETGKLAGKWREAVAGAHVLYVHRDPREVMVSYKQFLSPDHADVADITLGAFLRRPHWNGRDTMLEWWVRHVESWLAVPGIMPFGFRELTSDPHATLAAIGAHIGRTPDMREPFLPKKPSSINRQRLNRLLSLAPSSTAIIADAKRFPAPNWHVASTDDDVSYLQQIAGPLMERLGYDPGAYSPAR